jgi:hypothetical protein
LTTKVSAKSRGAHAQKEVEADHEIHKNLPSALASLLLCFVVVARTSSCRQQQLKEAARPRIS